MSSDDETVARFLAALRQDRDLNALALMIDPYLQMMGDKSGAVVLLDHIAELWAQARGGHFEVEVAA